MSKNLHFRDGTAKFSAMRFAYMRRLDLPEADAPATSFQPAEHATHPCAVAATFNCISSCDLVCGQSRYRTPLASIEAANANCDNAEQGQATASRHGAHRWVLSGSELIGKRLFVKQNRSFVGA
jgi:hypothetical protein